MFDADIFISHGLGFLARLLEYVGAGLAEHDLTEGAGLDRVLLGKLVDTMDELGLNLGEGNG